MSQRYDSKTDVILVRFSDAVIEDTDEISPGVLADYDAEGNVVGYEFLQASRRFPDPENADVKEFLQVPA